MKRYVLSQHSTALADRFWEKVERRGDDECWPWQASCNRDGYGKFKVGGTVMNASRIALELATGVRLYPDQVAMHSCDNRPCCNPAHLAAGSHRDNLADMVQKGRNRNGAMGKRFTQT